MENSAEQDKRGEDSHPYFISCFFQLHWAYAVDEAVSKQRNWDPHQLTGYSAASWEAK